MVMAFIGPAVLGFALAAMFYGMSTPRHVSKMSREQQAYLRRLPGRLRSERDLETLIRQNRLGLRVSAVIFLIFAIVNLVGAIVALVGAIRRI